MADTTALKNRIRAAVKANDNQEITGPVLQQSLLDMVDELDLNPKLENEAQQRQNGDTQLNNLITGIKNNIDNGYVYAGIATPSTNPVSGKVFYVAVQAGTYTNFGGTAVTEGITILKYNGASWVKEQALFTDGGVFDISAYRATGGTLATYADLTAALGTNGKNIPQSLRKGGMSVKFVQSSDNKYVQYRLMTTSFSTIESDWQNIAINVSDGPGDFSIQDEAGNILCLWKDGHIKTKNFLSSTLNQVIFDSTNQTTNKANYGTIEDLDQALTSGIFLWKQDGKQVGIVQCFLDDLNHALTQILCTNYQLTDSDNNVLNFTELADKDYAKKGTFSSHQHTMHTYVRTYGYTDDFADNQSSAQKLEKGWSGWVGLLLDSEWYSNLKLICQSWFKDFSDIIINDGPDDFSIQDEAGNILCLWKDGHIKTKNFDSKETLQVIDGLKNENNEYYVNQTRLIDGKLNPLYDIIPGTAGGFRNWGFIGDSLSSGERVYYDEKGGPRGIDKYYSSPGAQICNLIGCNYSATTLSAEDSFNYSWGGQTIKGFMNSNSDRAIGGLLKYPRQVYTIALGANDRGFLSNAQGDISKVSIHNFNNDSNTFIGGYVNLINRIKSVSPRALIFPITLPPGPWYSDWCNKAIRDVAKLYNNKVFVLDFEDCNFWREEFDNVSLVGTTANHHTPFGDFFFAVQVLTKINIILNTEKASIINDNGLWEFGLNYDTATPVTVTCNITSSKSSTILLHFLNKDTPTYTDFYKEVKSGEDTIVYCHNRGHYEIWATEDTNPAQKIDDITFTSTTYSLTKIL